MSEMPRQIHQNVKSFAIMHVFVFSFSARAASAQQHAQQVSHSVGHQNLVSTEVDKGSNFYA